MSDLPKQAVASGLNPDYSPRQDAVSAIAEHLSFDDSAYEDEDEANRQAERIMAAIERRGLMVVKSDH